MSLSIRPPEHDEPAVTSPALQRMVAAAREQTPPPLRTDADAVFAGFNAVRRRQRVVGVALGGLLAAGLAALALTRMDLSPTTAGPSGQVAEYMAPGTDAPRTAVLAAPIHIGGGAASVRGPWDVALAPGTWTIDVDDHAGDELLRAHTDGGTLELHHGRVDIVVGADRSEARLVHGVATWVARDGARSPLTVAASPVPSDSAGALARRAEAALTAGRRDEAITLLTRLVDEHAADPLARTALMDLAGLLKTDGRIDEARCAYRLYLHKHGHTAQLAGDVEKALTRLGDGPACDLLKPR